MKRDMDLIRKMLMASEESEGGYAPRDMQFDGYTESQIAYHAYLICDAGLAVGHDISSRAGTGPEWLISHLTWAGHEFVESARPPTRWEKTKSVMGKIGGAALAIWQKVLTEQAEQAVRDMITSGGG